MENEVKTAPPAPITTGTCKGCGAKIVWATLPDGGQVPLDPKPPVYRLMRGTKGELMVSRAPSFKQLDEGLKEVAGLVSHFSTCPVASQFSGSKKT